MMLYDQRARLMGSGFSISGVVAQLDVQAEAASALIEQTTIGQADQLAGQLTARNGEAKLRSDTGRLAGGERYAGRPGTQSFIST